LKLKREDISDDGFIGIKFTDARWDILFKKEIIKEVLSYSVTIEDGQSEIIDIRSLE